MRLNVTSRDDVRLVPGDTLDVAAAGRNTPFTLA
jgi:hypothetical protein